MLLHATAVFSGPEQRASTSPTVAQVELALIIAGSCGKTAVMHDNHNSQISAFALEFEVGHHPPDTDSIKYLYDVPVQVINGKTCRLPPVWFQPYPYYTY
jgi:hypothetical protein